jgi:hypothetical protein
MRSLIASKALNAASAVGHTLTTVASCVRLRPYGCTIRKGGRNVTFLEEDEEDPQNTEKPNGNQDSSNER